MKTEIKMLVLELHPIDQESIFSEGEFEETPCYELRIPIEEIVNWLGDIKWDNFKLIRVKGIESVDVYTEDELEDLQDEIDNLKVKLENAWGFIDNVEENLSEMRTRLTDALDDLDEAEDNTQCAKDECEE